MNLRAGFEWQQPGGAATLWRAHVRESEWVELASALRREGARLAAIWASDDRARGSGFRAHAAWLDGSALRVAEMSVDAGSPHIPSLAGIHPAAARMERAAFDLVGIRARGDDSRRWLRHEGWHEAYHPLASDVTGTEQFSARRDEYPFIRVSGDGVHEIPVGPVHAGIIEPGHFRFSVVGEKVLRLEERLGYVHKGIERCFQTFTLAEGHRLAARVSGDSCVAFSWAYCRALEAMSGAAIPQRAAWLRAVALELERLANHLGDLGALGNDAGFALGLAQFSRLKEQLLRSVSSAFGARYLMNFIAPGGIAQDVLSHAATQLVERLAATDSEVRALRAIYDDHPGLHDRFAGAGRVDAALASQLGLTGPAGRASGQAFDLRVDQPFAPYADAAVRMATDERGDVLARVAIRFEEALESIRLCSTWLSALPQGAITATIECPAAGAFGCGVIEGWRGPVLVALEAGLEGMIHRCHPHDPSWLNWPVLEHAIIGNIVPDFPLINKSFNLSYSGHDL